MNKNIIALLVSLSFASSFVSTDVFASAEHGESGHKKTEQHEQKQGPHGGFLLTDPKLTLELKLQEFAGNVELRVYGYKQNQPININDLNITMSLKRLVEAPQNIQFTAEGDYLVSTQSINEPHSFALAVTANYKGESISYEYDQHEGQTTLTERAIERAGIKTEIAQSGEVDITDTLFGVIAPTQHGTVEVMAPYTGLISDIFVSIGQNVKKGEVLASVTNRETLQNYPIKSPISGVVTEQYLKRGELASTSALMQVVNLDKVWVELSAFPENIEKLAIGQSAKVYDLHHHLNAQGEVFYIAPMMSGGHIARARIELKNPDGHWRPGMHVNSDISTAKVDAAVRVKATAVQEFNGKPSVFIKSGNVFEVRPVKLGAKNSEWVEVLEGLSPNSEYVTQNSYVIKADILKSGASHAH
ncbi:efflux RND transporter periplasmic adaptor subunit [Pseudoalteromonas sp. NZS71]|uniref:efflux RND transporter periplasmic adaptor subunit n=1 Tax=unclassified Pseudoalteromonas TaxID=194690 RepID=UPI0003F8AC3D|nr:MULTISPECIES: efflux RND transporter periplasmic adaptor subunit [unclassified Pseudoalteromonas]MBH0061338.1 efflux RND transporter periplasmic adaptor subunit [Pseudoalteromonas sp. NZS71]